MILALCIAIAAIAIDEIPNKETLQIFDQSYYHVQLSTGEKAYVYRLFRPMQPEPAKKYPLIVWLHGYGNVEFEKIGFGHLKHTGAVFESAEQARQLNFYFLAVQCPIDQPGFFRGDYSTATRSASALDAPEPGEVVVRLVSDLIDKEQIDPDRVTLVGISAGGSACLEMAMRYPERFAGIAVLGSPGGDLERVARLKHTPLWAFHSEEDPSVPVEGISQTVNTLNNAGGRAALTIIKGNMHNCWGIAFRDFALVEWLTEQNRTSRHAPQPGRNPSSFWQPMVVLGIATAVGVVVAASIKRHYLLAQAGILNLLRRRRAGTS